MTLRPLTLLLAATLFLPSCAQSLEQIVEQRHQARLDASMNNQPLRHGAGDGIGSRNAHVDATPTDSAITEDARLSLASPTAATPEADTSKNH